MARLTKEDWASAALDAILEGGIAAVAVEPLARRLGVTKGSFYAHFATRDDLVVAALERWEASHASTLRTELAAIPDPRERLLAQLRYAIAFSQSGKPSIHARLMADRADPHVRAALQRVSAARIAGLERSYRELGLTPATARHRARFAYATYVGLLQLAHEDPEHAMSPREVSAFVKANEPAFVPDPEAS